MSEPNFRPEPAESDDLFPDLAPLQEPLPPMTRADAEWYLAERGRLEHRLFVLKAQAAKQQAQVKSELSRLNWLHEQRVREYAQSEFDKTQGKQKTFHLDGGTLQFRKPSNPLRLTDEEQARAYTADNYETCKSCIRTVTVMIKPDYLKLALDHLQATGELLPGVEHNASTVFTVSIPKPVKFDQNSDDESENDNG